MSTAVAEAVTAQSAEVNAAKPPKVSKPRKPRKPKVADEVAPAQHVEGDPSTIKPKPKRPRTKKPAAATDADNQQKDDAPAKGKRKRKATEDAPAAATDKPNKGRKRRVRQRDPETKELLPYVKDPKRVEAISNNIAIQAWRMALKEFQLIQKDKFTKIPKRDTPEHGAIKDRQKEIMAEYRQTHGIPDPAASQSVAVMS